MLSTQQILPFILETPNDHAGYIEEIHTVLNWFTKHNQSAKKGSHLRLPLCTLYFRSVDLVFESLASLEDRSVARRNLDFFAGSRIAAGAGITVLAGEGAEASDGNRLTCSERTNDGIEDALDGCCCVFMAEVVLSSDFLDEFGFVHE